MMVVREIQIFELYYVLHTVTYFLYSIFMIYMFCLFLTCCIL